MRVGSLTPLLSAFALGPSPLAFAQRGAVDVTRQRTLDAAQRNLYPSTSVTGIKRPDVLAAGPAPPSC